MERMIMRRVGLLSVALMFTMGQAGAKGADVTSTWASASSGSWNVNANWTNVPALGGFPNNGNGGVATYDAVITAAGAPYTLTSGTSTTIATLQANSTDLTLTQSAGALTTTGAFNWSAGILNGAGSSNATGLFTWTGGTLSGTTFNANGGIAFSGSAVTTLSGATLNLATGQSATVSGTGALTMSNAAVFNNSGNFTASTNAGIIFGGGTPCMINNPGTFTRDTSAGTFVVGTPFSNTGTVTVGLGTLSLNGTVTQYVSGTLTAGTWNIMANSTLNGSGLANITTNKANVTLSGTTSTFNFLNTLTSNIGTLTLANGRNFTATASFTNTGTITAAPGSAFATASSFIWTAGTLNGGGTFTANGGTTMSGTAGKTAAGSTFGNFNTLTMTGTGALTLTNGQLFNNPGTFVAQSDAGIVNGTGTNSFTNGGTFTRNTSTGTFVVAVPFNNTGKINANSGALMLNGSVPQFSAGTLTSGLWIITANSTLGGSGIGAITTNNANVTLSGLNSIFTPMDSLVTNPGTFTLLLSRNFTTAGPFSNTGTVSAGVGSVFTTTGLFTWTAGSMKGGGTFNANAGLALSGSAGTTLDGSTLNNAAGQNATASGSGALSLLNGATFNNAGNFLAQSDAGIISGSGNNVFSNSGIFTRNPSAGTYVVASSFTNSGLVNVTSGTLQFNGTVSQSLAGQMFVQGGAAIFTSSFVNDGSVTVTGATAITFNGPVTNNGTILVCGGATLGGATSSFTNNGTLDVITASFTVPPGFVNNGILLNSSVVKIKQATLVGSSFIALIDSYTGHTYQFQRSTSLSGGTFSNIGAPQSGSTGTTLSFNDPSASPTEGYYRVLINP